MGGIHAEDEDKTKPRPRTAAEEVVPAASSAAYKVRSTNPDYIKVQDAAAHGRGASVTRPEAI